MPLPSFLQRKEKPPAKRRAAASAGDDAGPVQQARVQARRRLIGAVVLLAIGVIGFPMLFETQPRPIPVDIPIEIVREGAATAPAGAPRVSGKVAAEPAAVAAAAPPAASAPRPEPAAPPAAAPASVAAAPLAQAPSAAVARSDEGARAKALLEGKTALTGAGAAAPKPVEAKPVDAKPSDTKVERFVVQVGAYADADALQQARQKVEKLGLKTYTQVIETDAGKRTRVRVGPFSSRDEAVAAGGKLKGAGLPAHILLL